MRHNPLYQPITVDQFFSIDFGTDRKFELVDGVIQMVADHTSARARVAANILSFLGQKLRGTGCRPYSSTLGVRVDETNLCYPDISVYGDNPGSSDNDSARVLNNPIAIFEALPTSSSKESPSRKVAEYRQLESVDTIVFIDPHNELTRVLQRLGPGSWRNDMFAQHDIELPALGIVIPHAEIFARD